MINEIHDSSPYIYVKEYYVILSCLQIFFCLHKQNGTSSGTPMVIKYFYDGSIIQLCIYRMLLDACILLKLEGCASTRKQLHMYYITARMTPLPITCMMENLNKKILS
jgi:hypothetical protein